MPAAIILETGTLVANVLGGASDAVPGLLEFAGQSLAEGVIAAVREVEGVERVALAGPAAYHGTPAAAAADQFLEIEGNLAYALAEVVEKIGWPEQVMVFPTNGPLVTAVMFDNFLKHVPEEAAVAYAVLRYEKVQERFPDRTDWPIQRFREGPIVPSPLAAFRPRALEQHLDLIASIVSGQASLLQLIAQFGGGFLLRLKMGQVGLGELARKVSDIVGHRCAAIISPYPEICLLVQNREDQRWLQREIGIVRATGISARE